MITRRGIGVAVVAVAVFFVASATRVGWLHVADAVLWGVLLLSAALPHIIIRRLRVARRVSWPREGRGGVSPVVGDRVDVEIRVSNPSRWPRFFVAASHETTLAGRARQRFFFANVPARGVASASQAVECQRRGRHRFGDATLETRAPFGLFRRRRKLHAPLSLLVYPRWIAMRRPGLLDVSSGDSSGRRRSRAGDEVVGSRRYVVGDALRDIHWKNTARTGRPVVKEHDSGAQDALVIAFDTAEPLGEGNDTTLEYALSIAASVSRAATAQGTPVRLAYNGRLGQPVQSWPELMNALARVEQDRRGALAPTLRQVAPGARLLCVASGADRPALLALTALARRGVSVAAVVLEGFAAGDAASGALRALNAARVGAVVCRNGGLEEAMRAVERGASGSLRRAGASEVAA